MMIRQEETSELPDWPHLGGLSLILLNLYVNISGMKPHPDHQDVWYAAAMCALRSRYSGNCTDPTSSAP